ncbi:MAG: hypothetical protein KAX80_14355 [Planctomycetes bacterium]|nr:hypothetical protein [Planctomycetota bacterium]
MSALARSRTSAAVLTGGTGAAALSHLLGRSVRMLIGVPFVPSLVVGFPRATLLLSAAGALGRTGALTLMGVLEGVVLLAIGGAFPFAFLAPAVSAAATDVVGLALKGRMSEQRLLPVLGATLNVSRILTALSLWLFWGPPRSAGRFALQPWLVVLVLGLNVVVGTLAGFLARGLIPYLRARRLHREPAR